MSEFLTRFNFGELMGFLSVGGGLFIGFVAVAGGLWTDLRKAELAAALKHDMLDRGLSAGDIRMVLDAGTSRSGKVKSRDRSYCRDAEGDPRIRPERHSILQG